MIATRISSALLAALMASRSSPSMSMMKV